jgi:16S rRNA U1498 N3-methylase RsmE
VERDHRSILTLFSDQSLESGTEVRLDDAAAHHARVRRAIVGDPVRLLNGVGSIAVASISAIDRRGAAAHVQSVERVAPPSVLEVIVPVADRDRMLMAAEKCVELQVTAWRPAFFARSRSVGTRGEGEKFREKVIARMRSALEQSGGAWLPVIHPEVDADNALGQAIGDTRLILDASGPALLSRRIAERVALAVGRPGTPRARDRRKPWLAPGVTGIFYVAFGDCYHRWRRGDSRGAGPTGRS